VSSGKHGIPLFESDDSSAKHVDQFLLFSVDHGSPHYNEKEKQGVFYAESWALVHYLMLGDNGKRNQQFMRYLGLLHSGIPVEESFRQAFQADFATIEVAPELRRATVVARVDRAGERKPRARQGSPLGWALRR